ncbi:unnamed protein product, partial [Prorocentrum cordatum]
VTQCRRALGQHRRLYASDESNVLVAAAKDALARAEAAVRAELAPDDLPRSAKDNLVVKLAQAELHETQIKDLNAKLTKAKTRHQVVSSQGTSIRAEAAQAQAAVAAAAAALAQPVETAQAAEAASAIAHLQHILAQAQLAIQSGNSKESVGAQLLDSLAGQLPQTQSSRPTQQPIQ